MTSIQVPNLSAPVVQPRSDAALSIPLIIQVLQMIRENRMGTARNATAGIPEGVTFGALPPGVQQAIQRLTGRRDFAPGEVVRPLPHEAQMDQAEAALANVVAGTRYSELRPEQQVAYRRRTGRSDVAPDEVIRPYTGPQEVFNRAAPEGSPLRTILDVTLALHTATGGTVRATTAEGALAEASANVARAGVERTTAGNLASAQAKLDAGRAGEMSQAELAAYQAAFNFVPSQVVAENMTATLRSAVMQEGIRVLSNPDQAGFGALLAQYGTHVDPTTGQRVNDVTLGNLVGAVAAGVGTQIDQAMGLRNIVINNAGQARNIALEAMYRTASAVSTAMGGRYSPTQVAAVMQGDPTILRTPEGRGVQALLNASFNAAMLEAASKGDVGARNYTQNLELMRNPQIASDPRLAASLVEANRMILANSLTNVSQGLRPEDPPPSAAPREAATVRMQQRIWDTMRDGLLSQMMFFSVQRGGGLLGLTGRRLEAAIPQQAQPSGMQPSPTTPGDATTTQQLRQLLQTADQIILNTVPSAAAPAAPAAPPRRPAAAPPLPLLPGRP